MCSSAIKRGLRHGTYTTDAFGIELTDQSSWVILKGLTHKKMVFALPRVRSSKGRLCNSSRIRKWSDSGQCNGGIFAV